MQRQPAQASADDSAAPDAQSPQTAVAPPAEASALARLDLPAPQASDCFAIQLELSDQPIDPTHVPNLDIFSEYRLYSLKGLDEQGRAMHVLRLGFFSSEMAAEAVASYMREYFQSPAVKRVSLAERHRFEEANVTAGKDIGASGSHAVIELQAPKPLPEPKGPEGPRTDDTGSRRSLWSRLVAPLRR